MIRPFLLLAAVSAPAFASPRAAAPAPPSRAPAAAAARETLRRCGGAEAALASQPDGAWTAQPGALADHAALRAALGEPMPHAAAMVMVYAAGGHLSTEQDSIVLVRRHGVWEATWAARRRIWIKDAPWTPIAPRAWTLAGDDARRIDRILADRCFAAEPSAPGAPAGATPAIGPTGVHLDILTHGRRRSIAFIGGDARGLTAELIDLIERSSIRGHYTN